MMKYKDLSGNSGIDSYESGPDSVAIRFKVGATYIYNYSIPGEDRVEEMKRLAEVGEGFNTYISQHVKKDYYKKL